MTAPAVFAFDHDHGVPARTLAGRLGGKGAGLAEMTTALGLPVPPGFTIAVDVCHTYLETGWPDGLTAAVDQHCAALGARLGRRFGDAADPLLLAVRSGAPRSMPGMLDTVLNLGLTPDTVDGLARVTGDPAFARDCYRRFLRMYATTVLGCTPESLGPADADADALRAAVRDACGQGVPDDPAVQLRAAIEAVFRSCGSGRAQAYRRREGLDGVLGTAVNVQAMVFGNRGADSGTGVVFTRDPSTGDARRYGDYLPRAQGEDVVAGTARTLPISRLSAELPAVWAELDATLGRLERHYADICDVEFTIEQGRLWVLQTRVGKRSAVAAVRAAVQMAEEPDLPLSRADAVRRVGDDVRSAARQAVLAAAASSARGVPVARGLGASPGRATGRAVFSSDAAADAGDDEPIVLIRPETSPEDVPGMAVAVGIVTATGGLVSHAAVVARGWGLPAVVGAEALLVDESGARTSDGTVISPGDVMTLDGTTGEVWLGADPAAAGPVDDHATISAALPELLRLEEWAGDTPRHGGSPMQEFRFDGRDGVPVAGYRWEPDGPPRGVVQLTHGVGEHLPRYDHLARTLTAAGFVVLGHDSRGHGATIAPGAEPGVVGAEGWRRTVEDIGVLGDRAREEFPGLPLALVAHSMGSFATQQFLLDHSDRIDAVALSGTGAVDLLEPALDLDAGLDLSAFNGPFEPGRTGYEWLSRDEAQVDLYVADPLCGFGYDVEGLKAVFAGARDAADPARVAGIRPDLPIYITVGDADPVNGQLALVHALVDRYRTAGVTDVELRAYAEARHEVFNETNRDEVEADLLTWLDRVVPAR